MKIAIRHDTKGETFTHRVISTWEKGSSDSAVHVALIFSEQNGPGQLRRAIVGSADGTLGVYVKTEVLEFGDWQIYDASVADHDKAWRWFSEHQGAEYDYIVAAKQTVGGFDSPGRYNCSESVGAALGLANPDLYAPSAWADWCDVFLPNVTAEFFGLVNAQD